MGPRGPRDSQGLLWDVKLRDILQEEELSTREAAGITRR